MKCNNCGVKTDANVKTVNKHINGTVNRYRTVTVATCDSCTKQIAADQAASSERAKREHEALVASLKSASML